MLKKGSFFGDLSRYAVVGGVAFVVDFGTLFALTEYGRMNYLLSAALAFTLGLLVNYALSVTWVFEYRKMSKKSHELMIFTVIGLVGLGLNEMILFLLTDLLLIYYLYSKLAATGTVFFWNFMARRYSLFSKRRL